MHFGKDVRSWQGSPVPKDIGYRCAAGPRPAIRLGLAFNADRICENPAPGNRPAPARKDESVSRYRLLRTFVIRFCLAWPLLAWQWPARTEAHGPAEVPPATPSPLIPDAARLRLEHRYRLFSDLCHRCPTLLQSQTLARAESIYQLLHGVRRQPPSASEVNAVEADSERHYQRLCQESLRQCCPYSVRFPLRWSAACTSSWHHVAMFCTPSDQAGPETSQRAEMAAVERVDRDAPLGCHFPQWKSRKPSVCGWVPGWQRLAIRLFQPEHGHGLEADGEELLLLVLFDLLVIGARMCIARSPSRTIG